MTTGNVSRVLRVPGRLVVGPTDLAAAFPYGGVAVGKTRLVVLQQIGTPFVVMSEGLGEPTDILERDRRWIMSCLLRGWDDDALAHLFSSEADVGAETGHAVFEVPGSASPGASLLPRAKVVLFAPDNAVDAPAALLYAGVPVMTPGGEIAFQRGEELVLPLTLQCVRSAAGKILAVGRLADLTL